MLVLVATLTTAEPIDGAVQHFCFTCGPYVLADLVVNVAMLIPLGVLFALRWPGTAVRWLILLPILIEVAQLWVPGRYPTISDVTFNVIGISIGYGVGRAWPRVESRTPGLAVSVWAVGVATAVLVFGWLREPDLPDSTYFMVWNPALTLVDPYPGPVLSADLGGREFAQATPLDGKPIAEALEAGQRLTVSFQSAAFSDSGKPLGIVGIWDGESREILLLGVRNGRFLARSWTRGASFKLRSWTPTLAVPAESLRPGVATVTVWMTPERLLCLAGPVDGGRCDTLPSVANWWTMLFVAPAERLVRVLDSAGLVLLMIPFGLLAGGTGLRVLAIGGAVSALVVSPALFPVQGLMAGQWLLAALGVLAGIALRAAARECWAPATALGMGWDGFPRA